MKHILAVLLATVAIGAGTEVLAHHSFAAEFDASKAIRLTGTLTKVDWTNPHIYFYLDVKDAKGKVTEYAFSSGPPGTLRRAGVKKTDFKIGDTVTVTGAPAKDGTKHLGWLKMIKYS